MSLPDRRTLRRSKVRRQRVRRCPLASHWWHLARDGCPHLLAHRNKEPTGILKGSVDHEGTGQSK